jgi:phosphoribosyl-ATP pyrophosphohydrolase/phosphoribosyl-AMP cyclohydrolase
LYDNVAAFACRLATFYSRSRKERWCKGETSGHYIKVMDVYLDCDRDSLVYLSSPIGPACHTNAATCYFTSAHIGDNCQLEEHGEHTSRDFAPMTTLYALERTINQRKQAAAKGTSTEKPSWTVKLLNNPELICKKVREEAGELCQTWEENEGELSVYSHVLTILLGLQDH